MKAHKNWYHLIRVNTKGNVDQIIGSFESWDELAKERKRLGYTTDTIYENHMLWKKSANNFCYTIVSKGHVPDEKNSLGKFLKYPKAAKAISSKWNRRR